MVFIFVSDTWFPCVMSSFNEASQIMPDRWQTTKICNTENSTHNHFTINKFNYRWWYSKKLKIKILTWENYKVAVCVCIGKAPLCRLRPIFNETTCVQPFLHTNCHHRLFLDEQLITHAFLSVLNILTTIKMWRWWYTNGAKNVTNGPLLC